MVAADRLGDVLDLVAQAGVLGVGPLDEFGVAPVTAASVLDAIRLEVI